MNVCGGTNVTVTYKKETVQLPILIVSWSGPALLGRDWLYTLKLDWNETRHIDETSVLDVESLIAKYEEVFGEELGSLVGQEAVLEVQEGARPRSLRARPVPCALKEAIAQELNRLEAQGIIEKVDISEWATPIAPIPKADGSIRLCGDFKVTLNPVLKTDQYPLPRCEDLFPTLANGERSVDGLAI